MSQNELELFHSTALKDSKWYNNQFLWQQHDFMTLCSIATFGLKYGMPRFMPRNTNKHPKENTTMGTSFFI
jgi:hypothetical protein